MLSDDDPGWAERRKAVLRAVAADKASAARSRSVRTRSAWLAAASVACLSWVVVSLVQKDESAGGGAQAPNAGAPSVVAQAPQRLDAAGSSAQTAERAAPAATTERRADVQGQKRPRAGSPEPEASDRQARAFPASPEQTSSSIASASPQPAAVAAAPEPRPEIVADARPAAPQTGQMDAAPAARMRAPAGAAANATAAKRSQERAHSTTSQEMLEAVASGRAADVERLLDQGQRVETTDVAGDTPLLTAVKAGHAEVAALLLKRGADRGARGADGRSAEAIARGSSDPAMRDTFGR